MSERYRVPKRQAPARITLVGQPPVQLFLYLAECAERHSGTETPSDLINNGDEFLPATDPEGRVVILRRSSIMVLSVAAEFEASSEEEMRADEQLTRLAVDLRLENGVSLRGEMIYWRPEGQRRIQDYLNTAERFIPVRDGNTVHLVNRDRVVSFFLLESEHD